MFSKLFPDFAAKQALQECNVERGDELIITALQTNLVTRCLTNILKNCMIHAICNKRRMITEKDVSFAHIVSVFPYKDPPANSGHLIDKTIINTIIEEHISMLMNSFAKCGVETDNGIRVSQDICNKIQNELEGNIRGFISCMSMNTKIRSVTLYNFNNVLAEILGDVCNSNQQDIYTPFVS